jgi:hypothetical protein
MIKGKFGSALRSKSDTGQINEVHRKVLAHSICVLIQAMHALNIHPIFGSEIQPEQKWSLKEIFGAKPSESKIDVLNQKSA